MRRFALRDVSFLIRLLQTRALTWLPCSMYPPSFPHVPPWSILSEGALCSSRRRHYMCRPECLIFAGNFSCGFVASVSPGHTFSQVFPTLDGHLAFVLNLNRTQVACTQEHFNTPVLPWVFSFIFSCRSICPASILTLVDFVSFFLQIEVTTFETVAGGLGYFVDWVTGSAGDAPSRSPLTFLARRTVLSPVDHLGETVVGLPRWCSFLSAFSPL